MLKSKVLAALAASAIVGGFAVTLLSHCGSSTGATVNTYITSSNKGDLATFSFNDNNLNITWNVTHTGTGVIDKTLSIVATCGTVNATYGYRDCTVTSGSCTNGAVTCAAGDAPSAGDIFKATEAPGIGLMVLTPDSDQLFVGITAGSCDTSVTGNYLAIHLGVGQQDLFTLFSPNAAFTALTKADFRMTGTSNVASATLNYDGTGSTPDAMTLTGSICSNGIRTFSAGGQQMAATLAQNGMFVIDQPAGQGGILAFPLSSAATLADLAGKDLKGIAFPDDASPVQLHVQFAATAGANSLAINSVQFNAASAPPSATSIETFGSTTSPFTGTATPATYSTGAAYSTSSFHSTYANLSTVPGLFHIPPAAGDHGNVIAAVMKQNGKVLMFGAVWNDRSSSSPAVPTATAFPNTGSFIAFEQ